jgi:hypothetical protein
LETIQNETQANKELSFMSRLPRSAALIAAAAIHISVIGCGPKPQVDENRSTVSGTITLGGKPLKAGTITFDSTENGMSTAISIGSEGRFSTNRVPLGSNIVTIETESLLDGSPHLYTRIPAKYADPSKSGLSIDIKPDTNENVNFELKP